MLKSLTILLVSVPLPCFPHLSHASRDTSVVNGEILYFLYMRHKNGNIAFPLFVSCRAWPRSSFIYPVKGKMFMALIVTHISFSTSE